MIEKNGWTGFLHEYARRNEGEPTRVGVFESHDGVVHDYWLEDGLPLLGFDCYENRGKVHIDILFDNLTHSIDDAVMIVEWRGDEIGTDTGLDILDSDGRSTIIRFETWPSVSGDN